MDDMGGTIKDVVICQVKSKKVAINWPIEFCDAAYKFVSSIKYLYKPEAYLLEEPYNIFLGKSFGSCNPRLCIRSTFAFDLRKWYNWRN